MPRLSLAGLGSRLLLVAALLLTACSRPGPAAPAATTTRAAEPPLQSASPIPPPRDSATTNMVELLARLARDADPEQNLYMNDRRAAALQKLLGEGPPLPAAFPAHGELARQLVRAGLSQEGLDRIAAIRSAARAAALPLASEFDEFLLRLEGVALLRLGEQQNCIQGHSADSCIFPIAGGGVHRFQAGSRAAVQVFARLLLQHPDDAGYRWLLNLGYMTLGEYPEGVPEAFRIPPSVLRPEAEVPRFPDVAMEAGLAHVGLSGGSVLDDLDGDGLRDVVVTSWGLGDQMHYFHNQGDGRFVDRTSEAGLLGQVGGLNLNHADYDNDGDLDLLVLRGGWLGRQGRHPSSLLANDGRGRFRDATVAAGLFSTRPTQTAAWGDFDGDGWLDLFVGNESTVEDEPCELYHNQGDGSFQPVAAAVGLAHVGFVKAAVWGDVDNDGDLDLFLSQMGQTNVLYRNLGPSPEMAGGRFAWRFRDVSTEAGIGLPLKSFPAWFFDYDNDGDLDLVVGSFGGFAGDSLAEVAAAYLGLPSPIERTRLFRNRGDGRFEDLSHETGFDRPLLAMGANFGDIDNDGWLDAYFGTGEPELATLVPNVMLRNDRGMRFQDVSAAGGFSNLQKGHGISFGDVDEDGDQDILVVLGGAFSGDLYANQLLENPGNGHRWVRIRLRGTRANRNGVGARVHLQVEMEDGTQRDLHRVLGSGGSFGSSPLELEVGLGAARSLRRVEIEWPGSRATDVHLDLPLERAIELVEGDPEPKVRELKSFRLGGTDPAPHHHPDHGKPLR